MSVFIVLACDVEDVESSCGARLYLPADNAEQARRSAEAGGWTHVDGKDRCRPHSQAPAARPAVFGGTGG